MKIIRLSFLALLFTLTLHADTPFLLTGIKKVYPVVEIHNDYVPPKYKAVIMKKLEEKLNSLGISTKGYSQRSIAFLITGVPIGEEPAVHVKLLIGEEVKRIDDGEEVFAMTYSNDRIFEIYNLDDDLNENVDDLLEIFAKQYKEDNE